MSRTPWQILSLALALMLLSLLGVLVLFDGGALAQAPAAASRPISRPAIQVPQGTALLRVAAPDETLKVGQTFTVSVAASQVDAPLSAFQFDLAYDPTVIGYVGHAAGGFLAATGRATACPPVTRPAPGRVRLACASTGQAEGAVGEGVLASFTFQALGNGTSDLTPESILLPDTGRPPVLIPADAQGDQVTVGKACTALTGLTLDGSATGLTTRPYTFTATVSPAAATQPISFTWAPQPQDGQGTAEAVYQWEAAGEYAILVSAQNCGALLEAGHTISISRQSQHIYLPLIQAGQAITPSREVGHVSPPGIVQGDTASSWQSWGWWPIALLPLLLVLSGRRPRRRRKRVRRPGYSIFALAVILSLLVGPVLSVPTLAARSDLAPPAQGQPRTAPAKEDAAPPPRTARPSYRTLQGGPFWADLDGDLDIDGGDLAVIAERWDCATGDDCYTADYDYDGDGAIEAQDLAYVGNEYDVEPPSLTVLTPANGAVIGGTAVEVTGQVSDDHALDVTVNGVAATLNGEDFSATVPVAGGNQSLHVQATDALGQLTTAGVIVGVDSQGPAVTVNGPRHRQAVYDLRPTVAVSYTDYYADVAVATLQVTLTPEGSAPVDVTGDLAAGPDGALGTLSFDLVKGAVYTLTATVEDVYGNAGAGQAVFYVPADADGVTPPAAPDGAGWVSGVVYDSSTCDEYLTECQGLAGARVTLAPALTPTQALDGVVVTGPDGFYAFPVETTDDYALRVEKEGYTYGQRQAEIVRQRSTPVNDVYLTPLDPAVTVCDETGCDHTSADGQMVVSIPPGAIAAGDTVTVTATEFDQVEFLPSGELPAGTWETYAFNLGGDSLYSFGAPVDVKLKNWRNFAPGTEIPLGYWNPETLEWEHEGTGVVEATGAWVEMEVTHFSNYDINFPIPPAEMELFLKMMTARDQGNCGKDDCGSDIALRSGVLRQELALPSVQVLDEAMAPAFTYDSGRADPSALIEADLGIDYQAGIEIGDYVQVELYIEGSKTENLTFEADALLQDEEQARFRYLWDGRNAQGERLPAGVYRYSLRVRVPYRAQYYLPIDGQFGNPPDYTQPAGSSTDATTEKWLHGSVTLDAAPLDAPFGLGWQLAGQQTLYEDEAGHILIDDGEHDLVEFYYPGKNLLELHQAQGTGDHNPRLEASPTEYEIGDRPSSMVAEYAAPSAPLSRQLPASHLTTDVSGNVVTHTTWVTAESPYLLTGDVTVNQGVTLTIEPGVTVVGQDGVELRVQGHLSAVGTLSDVITFTAESGWLEGWAGLAFDGGTGLLRHVKVQYGGDSNSLLPQSYYGCNIAVKDVLTGAVRIEESRIRRGANGGDRDYGLYAENSRVVLNDTLLELNGDQDTDYALYATGAATEIAVTGSTFQSNSGRAVRVPMDDVHQVQGNTYVTNGSDYVYVPGGTFAPAATLWADPGLDGYVFYEDANVSAGQVLTIEAGLTLKSDDAALNVYGHLDALGTDDEPILFTSLRNVWKNEWQGIVFEGGTGLLRHATVRFGGSVVGHGDVTVRDVITGQVRIEDCDIRHTGTDGGSWGDYGLRIENSHVTVSGTLFYDIHDDRSDRDYALSVVGDSVVTATNNVFQENEWAAYLPTELANAFRGNVLIENDNGRVRLHGATTFDRDLQLYTQDGLDGFTFLDDVTIAAGATFTVPPGLNLYWGGDDSLTVHGHLHAIGTDDEKVRFSSEENSNGGEWPGILIEADGSADIEYAIIRYADTGLTVHNGRAAVRYATIYRNQDYGIRLTGDTANFAIHGSNIRDNARYLVPDTYGLRNDTGVLVDARYNWWGHLSGPYHASQNPGGQGDEVSDDVLFEPWLEEEAGEMGIQNRTATDNTTLTYDLASDTYTRHYPDGMAVHFNSDGSHDYTRDPAGNTLAYVYDPDGTLARLEFTPAGVASAPWVWTFAYTRLESASPLTITDPAGRQTTFELDEHNHLISIQQPGLSAPRTFAYDARHRMTHKQDERGYLTTYVYDNRGRLARTELPPREVYDPLTGTFSVRQEVHEYAPSDVNYPLANDLASPGTPVDPNPPLTASEAITDAVTMPDGSYSGQTNQWGSPTSIADPLGRQTATERNEANLITRLTTPEGTCAEFDYDEKHNLLVEQRMGPAQCALEPADRDPGQVQTYTHTYESRFNQIKTETDPLDRTTTYFYDYELGQGERGLLVKIEYPEVDDGTRGPVTPVATFEYNAWGQTTRAVDLRGVATCFVYSQGTADEASDGSNPLFAPGVTPVPGLLTQVIKDCGGSRERTTTYREFDAAGNPQSVVEPAAMPYATRTTQYAYDARNRTIAETEPPSTGSGRSSGMVTTYAYDNADNVVQIVADVGGQEATTELGYDAANLLTSERVGGAGETIQHRFGYDLDRNRTLVQDGRGNATRYVYDAAGRLVRLVDAGGHERHLAYDGNDRLATLTDARGTVTRYTYDAWGNTVQIVEDEGGLNLTSTYTYDLAGNLLAETDPSTGSGRFSNGVTTCYEYDALDRLTAETRDCGGLDATIQFAYDLEDNLTTLTDPLGAVTHMAYDSLGYLTVITNPLGGTQHFAYDLAGNVTASTDERGHTTTLGYDALDRMAAMTNALGHTTEFGYDALGNQVAVTDTLGAVTHYGYDTFQRRTSVTDPLGNTTTFGYDAAHNQTSVTDPLGRTTHHGYDSLNRHTNTVDPLGHFLTMAYDANGNPTTFADGLGRTTEFGYDALNRQTRTTDPLDHETHYDYDPAGNLIAVTDPLGHVTEYGYDGLYHQTVMTDTNDGVTFYAYDLAGNRTGLTDPEGNLTTFAYDALGRLTTETNQLGQARTYTYDAAGNLTSLIDRNGRERQFQYDAVGQLINETWVGDGHTVSLSYDAVGQLVAAADPHSTYALAFDAAGRNTTVDNTGTPGSPHVVMAYAYDAAYNLRSLAETIDGAAGATTAFQYDALNRMQRLTQSGPDVAPKRVDLAYDAADQLADLHRYADLNGVQPVAASQHTYDAAGRLTGLTHTPQGVPPLAYQWTFDAADRVVQAITPDGASDLVYDALDQLTGAVHDYQADEAYTYDQMGNRIDSGYVTGDANRLLSDGVYDYEYDAEGNRTRRTEIASGAVTEYEWDYRNRLTRVVFRDTAEGAATKEVVHTYDAFDRRIGRTVDPDGDGPLPAATERFVYDGAHIALTFDGDGVLTHRYLYGPALDMVLADENAAGEVFWPLADHEGTVRDVLDAAGAVQNHLTYDSFGRITGQSDPAATPRFAYTGREWDAETGLYFYRSRYYDPAIGRFLSEDLLGFEAGDANLYRYVGNNPVNLTDPLGYGWFDAVDRFAAGFADSVTFGGTTWLRKKIYGKTATKNHQGTAFGVGQGAGFVWSIAMGFGGAKASAQAANATRQAKWLSHALRFAGKSKQMLKYGRRLRALKVAKMGKLLGVRKAKLLAGWLKFVNAAHKTHQGASAAFGVYSAGKSGYKLYKQDPCDPFGWMDAFNIGLGMAPFTGKLLKFGKKGAEKVNAFFKHRKYLRRLKKAWEKQGRIEAFRLKRQLKLQKKLWRQKTNYEARIRGFKNNKEMRENLVKQADEAIAKLEKAQKKMQTSSPSSKPPLKTNETVDNLWDMVYSPDVGDSSELYIKPIEGLDF